MIIVKGSAALWFGGLKIGQRESAEIIFLWQTELARSTAFPLATLSSALALSEPSARPLKGLLKKGFCIL